MLRQEQRAEATTVKLRGVRRVITRSANCRPPPESNNGRRCHAGAERVGWGSPRLKNRVWRRFLSAPVSK
jgi:hypothetical protein